MRLSKKCFQKKKAVGNEKYSKARVIVDGKELKSKIRVRGAVRKTICNFPPLKLKISSKDSGKAETVFQGANAFKIVTHCEFFKNEEDEHEQFILIEYLLYKFYQTLTARSFNVRFAEITYRDSVTNTRKTRFAFLIENKKQLASRNHSVYSKSHLMKSAVDYGSLQNSSLVRLFELFIGNGDYSLWGPSNIKHLRSGENEIYAVPYDFDRSAFVSMPFQKLDKNEIYKKIMSLQRGLSPEEILKFNQASSNILMQSEAWDEIISSFDVLELKYRRSMVRRRRVFFEALKMTL